MRKTSFFWSFAMALTLGGAGEALAEAKIRFPLVGWEYAGGAWKKVALRSLNPALKAAGQTFQFEDQILAGPRDGKLFHQLSDQLDQVNQLLQREIEFIQSWDPSRYIGLCYVGPVQDVIKTVSALRGYAFGSENSVWAYRHGTFQWVFENFPIEDHREANPRAMAIWDRYDQRSASFVMLTDGGSSGDGTELFATTIPPCRR